MFNSSRTTSVSPRSSSIGNSNKPSPAQSEVSALGDNTLARITYEQFQLSTTRALLAKFDELRASVLKEVPTGAQIFWGIALDTHDGPDPLESPELRIVATRVSSERNYDSTLLIKSYLQGQLREGDENLLTDEEFLVYDRESGLARAATQEDSSRFGLPEMKKRIMVGLGLSIQDLVAPEENKASNPNPTSCPPTNTGTPDKISFVRKGEIDTSKLYSELMSELKLRRGDPIQPINGILSVVDEIVARHDESLGLLSVSMVPVKNRTGLFELRITTGKRTSLPKFSHPHPLIFDHLAFEYDGAKMGNKTRVDLNSVIFWHQTKPEVEMGSEKRERGDLVIKLVLREPLSFRRSIPIQPSGE